MNKSNAHLYLPLVQALADGKLQFNGGDQEDPDWQDVQVVNWTEDPDKYRIKPLSFPPIPEGMTLHNPDNLTAEQVGDGWRLMLDTEPALVPHEAYVAKKWIPAASSSKPAGQFRNTFRVPAPEPFPDGSYLKEGQLVRPWVPKFKVGDRVQMVRGTMPGIVREISEEHKTVRVEWSPNGIQWEIESGLEPYVWNLTRHIPGFRPLRDGEEWHRQDWTEEMLPDRWRPLLKGELWIAGDEVKRFDGSWRVAGQHEGDALNSITNEFDTHCRTRRPLPDPEKRVPLEPSDWMKDGPWWIASQTSPDAFLVLHVRPDGIDYLDGSVSHEIAVNYQRSNDGITWSLCSKPA